MYVCMYVGMYVCMYLKEKRDDLWQPPSDRWVPPTT